MQRKSYKRGSVLAKFLFYFTKNDPQLELFLTRFMNGPNMQPMNFKIEKKTPIT